MHWCFGLVNGRLAHVFFDIQKDGKKHVFAHSYINARELRSKREKEMMKSDVKKTRLLYRNRKYRRLVDGKSVALK